MTTSTAVPRTTRREIVVRVIRTLVELALGFLAALVLVPFLVKAFPGIPHAQQIVGVVTVITTAATAFFSSPAGNWLLSFVSLDATTVQKITADTNTAVTATETAVTEAAPAVEQLVSDAKSKDPALTSLQDATKDAPEVVASVKKVVDAVETVAADIFKPEPATPAASPAAAVTPAVPVPTVAPASGNVKPD